MPELVVVCEARADFQTVSQLADRVILAQVPWADGTLEHVRRWLGDAERPFIKWTEIKKHTTGRRFHGRYGGPNKGEYLQARKALRVVAEQYPEADAVFLVRDEDRGGRRADYENASTTEPLATVILAIAAPEREAWHIVGFEPRDATERTRYTEEKARLGADPRGAAHTLNPKRDAHPRSTKRVLEALTAGDSDRASACLDDLDLSELKARGGPTGLTAYLESLEARLVPLFKA
jgi:hypothetical protein